MYEEPRIVKEGEIEDVQRTIDRLVAWWDWYCEWIGEIVDAMVEELETWPIELQAFIHALAEEEE